MAHFFVTMHCKTNRIMTRKLSFILAAFACTAFITFSCTPKDQPENNEEEEVDLSTVEKFKLSVPITENWVYEGRPTFTIEVKNPNDVAVPAMTKIIVTTDKGGKYKTINDTIKIKANSTQTVVITPDEDFDPGFYQANIRVNNRSAHSTYVFGVSPTKIKSDPDMQADFTTYWEGVIAELEALDMNPVLTEIPSHSSSARKVYLVEFNSVPDTPGGEPAIARGYYCEPQDGQKHPILMHFEGYDDLNPSGQMYCPYGGSSQDFAEFYMSTRGQMINNRTAAHRSDGIDRDFQNTYGDWFAFHFGQKDGYYYRGAFMDCVQAVRFMAGRSSSDSNNIFAEGKSQGGALSYATAALSPYPLRAIAPGVAFLGDFPDYFKIVSWPGNVAKNNKGEMTDQEMYAFLSYFDTKNLATRISCAIMANIGLQDNICPPHTNIAPYNNALSTDKEMYFYPEMGHEIPSGWDAKYTAFFKARIK